MKTKERIIEEELDRILMATQGEFLDDKLTNTEIRMRAIKKILKLFSQQKREILNFLKDQKQKHYSADLIIKHLKGELQQKTN